MLSSVPESEDGTYISALLDQLARSGAREVLVRGDIRLSGEELRASVFRYAHALRELGVGPGDLVALFVPNAPDALAVRYAASLLGAPSVFLARPTSPQRRAALLVQTDPRLLVVFPETAVPSSDSPPNGQVASIGHVPGVRQRLDGLAAQTEPDPLPSAAHGEDVGVILSSGGTTGVPKGSWRSFGTYATLVSGPPRPDRRQLVVTPFAYLSQLLVDATLLGGGSVVLHERFDASAVLDAVTSERITDLFLVEPALFALMDHPELDDADLSSLRSLTHVGASAPEMLRQRARKRLGTAVTHSYGASEVGLVSALTPREIARRPDLLNTAGKPAPEIELRFRRSDGTLAPSEEGGVLQLRSPAMASGYWNRPEDEDAAFSDGWYDTGDHAYLDAEGYLHVLGRAGELRRTGGVPFADIEDVLCRLPGVRYAVAFPLPDGDGVSAAVVPWPGSTVGAEACRAAILSACDISVDPVVTVESVPVTEQGKPDRSALQQLAATRK